MQFSHSLTSSKLRVLCLPGFYNNVHVMTHQLKYYDYLFGEAIEFHVVDAPHECAKVFDPEIEKMFKGPFYSWYFVNDENGDC